MYSNSPAMPKTTQSSSRLALGGLGAAVCSRTAIIFPGAPVVSKLGVSSAVAADTCTVVSNSKPRTPTSGRAHDPSVTGVPDVRPSQSPSRKGMETDAGRGESPMRPIPPSGQVASGSTLASSTATVGQQSCENDDLTQGSAPPRPPPDHPSEAGYKGRSRDPHTGREQSNDGASSSTKSKVRMKIKSKLPKIPKVKTRKRTISDPSTTVGKGLTPPTVSSAAATEPGGSKRPCTESLAAGTPSTEVPHNMMAFIKHLMAQSGWSPAISAPNPPLEPPRRQSSLFFRPPPRHESAFRCSPHGCVGGG